MNRKANDVEFEPKKMQEYKKLLMKLKGKGVLGKLEALTNNPRLVKPEKFWAKTIDQYESTTEPEIDELLTRIKMILRKNLKVAPFLEKVLEYGLNNGFAALLRILKNNKVKTTLTIRSNEEIISSILENFFKKTNLSRSDYSKLEREHKTIKKKLTQSVPRQLPENDLRNLLAYEAWKDGADENYVEEVLKGKMPKRELLMDLIPYGY